MNAPYRDVQQAIRSALNVGARSLYSPASWQALAGSGYRESSLRGDMSRLESFQQACMTLALLHYEMPAHLWAILVVRYAPPLADQAEFDRMKAAVLAVAGHLECSRTEFARWAVAHWGNRLPPERARWDHWNNRDLGAISTLKRLYGKDIKPSLGNMERLAKITAENLLSINGVIEKAAA